MKKKSGHGRKYRYTRLSEKVGRLVIIYRQREGLLVPGFVRDAGRGEVIVDYWDHGNKFVNSMHVAAVRATPATFKKPQQVLDLGKLTIEDLEPCPNSRYHRIINDPTIRAKTLKEFKPSRVKSKLGTLAVADFANNTMNHFHSVVWVEATDKNSTHFWYWNPETKRFVSDYADKKHVRPVRLKRAVRDFNLRTIGIDDVELLDGSAVTFEFESAEFEDYTGPTMPSEQQQNNNARALYNMLRECNVRCELIPGSELPEMQDSVGDETQLFVVKGTGKNRKILGYYRWGFSKYDESFEEPISLPEAFTYMSGKVITKCKRGGTRLSKV